MDAVPSLLTEASRSLAMALIESSRTPLLMLDDNLVVIGASISFCAAFKIDPGGLSGRTLKDVGNGEWDVPQLASLLMATVRGQAAIDAYEMDLVRAGQPTLLLIVNAHKLDYFDSLQARLVIAVTDVTAARQAEQQKDDLVREKQIMLQELQHRVANSLQIIASVLLQSARKVQSEETRLHLRDAHNRVMSIAALQKQLTVTRFDSVALKPYFNDLCASIAASMIPADSRLTLTVSVDGSAIKPEASVSLGLIVTELVINALKHAFPGDDPTGAIVVAYRSEGQNWSLSVSDDGAGMPTNHADVKPGLGTGIVAALSKQLGAAVTVSDNAPGTKIVMHHPG